MVQVDRTDTSPPGSGVAAAVIVNYRTPELTRACVASILPEAGVTEVVVVDNASGDDSPEYLRAALTDDRVRVVVSDRNGGFGQGVNLGVSHCHAPFVLVMNSDATLAPGSLSRMVDALMTEQGVAVVAPAVYRPDGLTLQPAVHGMLPRRGEIIFRSLGRRPGDDCKPEWVSGVAMLVRRADFDAVGGFDESFEMYFEDVDLCRRLADHGRAVRRQPSAAVVHAGGRSWLSKREQVRRFHQSKLIYARKLGATSAELLCVRLVGLARGYLVRS